MKSLLSDTLFKRLFFLMWIALVASHMAGHLWTQHLRPSHDMGLSTARTTGTVSPSTLTADMVQAVRSGSAAPQARNDDDAFDSLPDADRSWWVPSSQWMDYLVRLVVIGLAAGFGARWLSSPMHRLADASRALGLGLGSGGPPPQLDEQGGTLEVHQTTHVFNTMARRLHEQFNVQGLLMAAISHDLRTPLARLRLRLEQLDRSPNTERCVDDVQEMDQMIASVLDMMRLNHEASAPQRVDATALVQALVDDFIEQGQAVSLHTAPDSMRATVKVQPSALNRVLANLIGNALRYGVRSEVSIFVRQGHLHVLVDDHGPGIPPHQLEAVFEPFYRVDSSRSKATGGTGLGLYIARDLAQRHNGRLTLSNRAEGGLRAELMLPLVE